MTDYFKIGKVVSPFGLKGEMILRHNLGKKTNLKGLRCLFIEEKRSSFIPWFVSSAKAKSIDEAYISFEGLNTREQAAQLCNKDVWMEKKDFDTFSHKKAPISFLHFTVIEDGKPLGLIEEIIEQPFQILARLKIEGKEVYIPLHDQTIQEINQKEKTIRVQLPPGLLEIYL